MNTSPSSQWHANRTRRPKERKWTRSFASSSSLRGASTRPSGRSGANGLSRSSSTAGAGASGDAATSAGANASAQRRNADLSYANVGGDDDFGRLLASYDVPLVVDVLRRYLTTETMEVQSSLTGASSKQNSAQIKRQFYERFNQVLDRLFGNNDVSKHKHGGWLDYSVGLAPAAAQRKKKLQSLGLLRRAAGSASARRVQVTHGAAGRGGEGRERWIPTGVEVSRNRTSLKKDNSG
jgi:hypothetical protein